MKKRGCLSLLVLLLLLLSLGGISAEEISSCAVLGKGNAAYYLSKDILSSGEGEPCIKITEENITLDCMNHSISSLDNPFGIGVLSESPRTKIQNCIIQDFKKGYGIYLENSDNSQLVSNVITGNKQGIEFSSNNTKLAYNSIIMNQNGVNISGNYNIINNNKICFNTIQDVSCGNNQTFENNYCDSGKVCGIPCVPCTHLSYEIYKCMELNVPNSVYLLNTDITVYIQETCFKISAENITLDCNSHRINSSLKTVPKEDFLVYSEENHSTVKNCYFESDLKDSRYYGNVIKIKDASHSSIINNSFKNTGAGVLLSNYCNSCTVKGNSFNSLNGKGIEAGTLVKGIIQDNKIVSTSAAIKIADGSDCTVKDNYIEDSKENAVEIKNNGAIVDGNEIISSSSSAIILRGSGSAVKNNIIENAGLYGIHLLGASDSSLEGNQVYSTSGGIFVEDSENLGVFFNNVGASSFGLKESSGRGLRISGNTFCGNEKDVICESKSIFNDNRCSFRNACGSCAPCGQDIKLSSLSLWQRIKMFFEWVF